MLTLVRSLLPYLKKYKSRALTAVLLSIPLAGLKYYQVSLVKPIFDKGLDPNSTLEQTAYYAIILLVVAAVIVPIRFLHFYWMRYVVDKASCDIREKVYAKLQRVPLGYYQDSKQGDLISKIIIDSQTLAVGFHGSVDLFREPLIGLAMLINALISDWQLTLVIFVTFPLFILIFSKTGKRVKVHQEQVQINIGEMTHNVAEGMACQKISKAFNLQSYLVDRFNRAQEQYFRFQMKAAKVEELASPLVELVGAMAFAGVIIFAHYRISSGAMSTGDFIGFVAALALLMDPIRKFSRANIRLNQASAAGKRIFEILNLPEEIDEGKEELAGFSHSIEIKDVAFSYGDKEVFNNFSLTINKGEKVALVGFSGSGKSTLIHLLLRLYNRKSGEILVDGTPIENLSLKNLRSLFGLVSQDIFLFNDTVKENLTLGHPDKEPHIPEALKVAYAIDFINQLENQVDTHIGDRGTKLSGGQSQRVTIARAYIKNAPILLFDEATSALDNESEKVVQEALESLAKDKTVITVAHRLSSIKDYDKIVVLDKGQIVEMGSHRDLMQKEGEYFRFYQLSQSPT